MADFKAGDQVVFTYTTQKLDPKSLISGSDPVVLSETTRTGRGVVQRRDGGLVTLQAGRIRLAVPEADVKLDVTVKPKVSGAARQVADRSLFRSAAAIARAETERAKMTEANAVAAQAPDAQAGENEESNDVEDEITQ